MTSETETLSAADRWRRQVQEHHAQTERASAGVERPDFWQPIAGAFRDDPERTEDPVLNRLASWIDAETTVLDVGGGAGRFAVPLAKRCAKVTVVEPSDSMIESLRAAGDDAGVDNIEVVQGNWETVEPESTDLVLCAHVVYGIEDIGPFIRKLHEHARKRVALVCHTVAPIAIAAPFWKAVHGEERVLLPSFQELLPVLWEMEIWPDVEMVAASRRRLPDFESALLWMRHLTWVAEGSEKEEALKRELAKVYDAETGEYLLRRARARQGIVTWVTESPA